MLRRVSAAILQSRGIKHQVKVNWVRPEFVPHYKPEKAGDLEPIPKISNDSLGVDYAACDEIKDAPESVKKLFSAAFLGKKEQHKLVKKELIDRVKRYEYDMNTAETRIARLTGNIRNFQEIMDKNPRNGRLKEIVLHMVDKRKKLLKFLRQYDYKKFEWLLETLNLEYKAHPDTYHKLSRKESLRKLTEMYCENIRNKKLDSYRNLLESQQGPFLEQKLDALKFIRSEQIELKLPVTVSEADIKKVEDQLKEWKIKDDMKQLAKKKKRDLITVTEL